MSEVGIVLRGGVVPDQDQVGQDLGGHHPPRQKKLGQAFTSHRSQLRTLKIVGKLCINNQKTLTLPLGVIKYWGRSISIHLLRTCR